MSDEDDDDEGVSGGLYENGHWVWDESIKGLTFVRDLAPIVDVAPDVTALRCGTVEFRDDVDLIEQIRFRHRYQRKSKPGQSNVIELQDIKDIAIFTAPIAFLSPALIDLLHIPTTERFIRAMILYCQFYLQVEEEMSFRMNELDTKIRTPDSELLELEFRDDLADLRIMVAKEYCTMLMGGDDTKKYHHMGPMKKRKSLSDKDARQFETMLRMCVQIVWLALARSSFNMIELEINRLFKSEIFNGVEHVLNTHYLSKMTNEEKVVLLGHCLSHDKKLCTRSPLMNEVFCHRQIDYRMMGLGVIKPTFKSARLNFLRLAVSGPEDTFVDSGVTCGILGLPRDSFDTMLQPIQARAATTKSTVYSASHTKSMAFSKSSTSEKSAKRICPVLRLPRRDHPEPPFPASLADASEHPTPCSEEQRCRWQARLMRLQPAALKRKSLRRVQ